MSLYRRNYPKPPVGLTEFEILRASHKFLRDEGELDSERSQALATIDADDRNATDTKGPGSSNTSSWNDQLAAKYYASLYREFALCDLKHYKSGNFALRWRTEDEVLAGAGETTCGNTRCEYHHPPTSSSSSKVPLTTLELPFGYIEEGKSKSALVKVVLCAGCLKKLMWKRNKEKGKGKEKEKARQGDVPQKEEQLDPERDREKEQEREKSGKGKRKREGDVHSEEETRRASESDARGSRRHRKS